MPLTRRQCLALSAAGVVAACAGDSSSSVGGGATSSPSTTATVPRLPAGLDGANVFTLGVASGDAFDGKVTLWTRLAPTPLTAGGGMPDAPAQVRWEVAHDSAFRDVVQSGLADAKPEFAHSVHVDVALEPGTAYHYRFLIGDQMSPAGVTSVLPAAGTSLDRVRFAMATCQDYASGYYAAHRAIAAEPDLAFVLFLGDYVYEFAGPDAPAPGERVNLGPVPVTLDDYRKRYAQYKS